MIAWDLCHAIIGTVECTYVRICVPSCRQQLRVVCWSLNFQTCWLDGITVSLWELDAALLACWPLLVGVWLYPVKLPCTCWIRACTVLPLAQHMDCYHPTCMHIRHTFSVCDWNYVCNYVCTIQYVCTYLVEMLQLSPSVVDAEFVCISVRVSLCITCCTLAKMTLLQMFW